MNIFNTKLLCSAGLFLLSIFCLQAQSIERIEPPNWWAGMNSHKLQLMVYGENIASLEPRIKDKGVSLEKINKVENPNYLFLDLEISSEVQAGDFDIDFLNGKKKVLSHNYELKARREGSAQRKGFGPEDVLYLITPDRFANGDESNDNLESYEDKIDRADDYARHGGDIAGINNHLDYIKDLGFTSIWVNPVLENAQPKYSYHGYATTDFYKVDPRFGSNEQYAQLSKKASEMGIGLIMDMIVNHCGHKHWWMEDLPSKDWINKVDIYIEADTFIKTNHMKSTIQDPHVAESDLDQFIHGWFGKSMPDLNVRNPYMAKYLIQNSIWWVEYADLQGIRMDTYSYPDKEFMTQWTCEVMYEYPNFNIVGEEWNTDPAIVSFWQRGKKNSNGYTSCLPSLMDFPLQSQLVKSLNAEEGKWASGWKDVYETLGMDFLYADPYNLVIFPDNHDMDRIFTQVNKNNDLFDLAIAYYSTMRGIPQFYYGTEILMSNEKPGDHGEIRTDFPGGWPGDTINAFEGKGLNANQKEAMKMIKNILNWRKNSEAIHKGKLLHYAPDTNSVYVFFRYTENDKVMTVLSKNTNELELDISRFKEILEGNEKGVDIISGMQIDLSNGLNISPMKPMIIDFE